MKHLMKRNNKEISAYLRDKQIECCTFNIIHNYPTSESNDKCMFDEALGCSSARADNSL